MLDLFFSNYPGRAVWSSKFSWRFYSGPGVYATIHESRVHTASSRRKRWVLLTYLTIANPWRHARQHITASTFQNRHGSNVTVYSIAYPFQHQASCPDYESMSGSSRCRCILPGKNQASRTAYSDGPGPNGTIFWRAKCPKLVIYPGSPGNLGDCHHKKVDSLRYDGPDLAYASWRLVISRVYSFPHPMRHGQP